MLFYGFINGNFQYWAAHSKCGGEPIVGFTEIGGSERKHYITPDRSDYFREGLGLAYFCTEQAAKDAGYKLTD